MATRKDELSRIINAAQEVLQAYTQRFGFPDDRRLIGPIDEEILALREALDPDGVRHPYSMKE